MCGMYVLDWVQRRPRGSEGQTRKQGASHTMYSRTSPSTLVRSTLNSATQGLLANVVDPTF